MGKYTDRANEAASGAPDTDEIGIAHLVNVSMTEAIAFDQAIHDRTKPETWPFMKAENYDGEKHGHLKFFCKCCLEKGTEVPLRRPSMGNGPNGGYYQHLLFDVLDPETGQPIQNPKTHKPKTESHRYYFPPHFTTYPHQTHAQECDAATNQKKLALAVREMGGTVLNSKEGVRFVGLNIPTEQRLIEHKRLRIGPKFDTAAGAVRRIHHSVRRRQPRLEGVHSTADLGVLLTHTEFDKGQRGRLLMRLGNHTMPLSELYHDSPTALFNTLLQREAQEPAQDKHAALFLLRLNENQKSWSRDKDGSTSVRMVAQGHTADGHAARHSVKINFQKPEAEQAFRKAFEAGQRDFLIYSEMVRIKPETGSVKMTVFTPHQIASWSPPHPQMDLEWETPLNLSEAMPTPDSLH